jgi:osmoprotectant transport system ATP-binding protein
MDAVVAIEEALVERGGQRVLGPVSLALGASEVMALVGASGAGKSTLLRLVNGLYPPSRGTVLTFGERPVESGPELRRRIGYVAQGAGLFPHRTVAQNVAAVPALLGWARDEIERRVDEALTQAGLTPETYRNRRPGGLSGGEAQRVAFARAIAARPRLLLLDEPFGALDAITRRRVRGELAELLRDGRAALLVTHDIAEAFAMADRIAVLEAGRIVQTGTRAELAEAPATAFVAELIRAAGEATVQK